jgi:hypothetical protein
LPLGGLFDLSRAVCRLTQPLDLLQDRPRPGTALQFRQQALPQLAGDGKPPGDQIGQLTQAERSVEQLQVVLAALRRG